jgi:hypothetical protein
MDFREFLKFERKKAILPVFLVVLLVFVLLLDALYADQTISDAKFVGDATLHVTNFVTYSQYTDENLKNIDYNSQEFYDYQQTLQDRAFSDLGTTREYVATKQSNFFASAASSYIPEYFLNTFGADFCQIFTDSQNVCMMTRLDSALPAEFVHLSFCLQKFLTEVGPMGKDGTIADFINTERGQNYFEMTEECRDSRNYIFDPEKMTNLDSNINVPFVTSTGGWPEVRLATPLDIAVTVVVVVITSYLLSCIVIWIHRKNNILQGSGKKSYVVILVFTLWFLATGVVGMRLMDYRLVFFVSLILAYIVTTVLWDIYGKGKERKIAKEVYKKRSKK